MRQLPGSDDPLELRLHTASTDSGRHQAARRSSRVAGRARYRCHVALDDGRASSTTCGSAPLDWDTIIYSWSVGADPDFILSSFTSRQCGFWSDTCYSNPEYDEPYR